MRRQIQGLHLNQRGVENKLQGLFLVRVERSRYRWHSQKPFVEVQFTILEPKSFQARSFLGRLYCTERALWKLNWFLRDFGYDAQLLLVYNSERTFLSKPRGVRSPGRLGSTRLHITGSERWAKGQRWSIATRRSANTYDAPAAIATAT